MNSSKKLKIASWNCRGAYRNKQNYLRDEINPDIWVIQECEHTDKLSKNKNFKYPANYVWYGDNPNKGIGIFSKEGYNLEISKAHSKKYEHIVPITVSGKTNLTLYAAWAMNAKNEHRKQRYIGQLFCAFNHYQLDTESTLIVGDYNWNLDFDKTSYGLYGKFSDFLEQMKEVNFKSAYHTYFSEDFGKESKPTLHLQGKKNKPYHVDYIFGSDNLIKNIENLKVGQWKDWQNISDHRPISVEFKL